ncbi:MAG TPA: SRPBCC family protein [Actinomycetales bacterium]|nr:SRPBCC family protein [Actinomycetales bacterium]
MPREQSHRTSVSRAVTWTATGTLLTAAAAGARRWMATWGSDQLERGQRLPGDELVAAPVASVTRAITIEAPAEDVWPWIAQMGSSMLGRAGWYSYDRLDNAGAPSAVSLLDFVPEPRVGDVLVPDPRFAWTVQDVQPGRHLLLDISSPPGWFRLYATWLLLLRPAGESRCRLVERSSWEVVPRALGQPFSLLFEPVDFVMMRRHLLNVRARARHPRARSAAPVLSSTAYVHPPAPDWRG